VRVFRCERFHSREMFGGSRGTAAVCSSACMIWPSICAVARIEFCPALMIERNAIFRAVQFKRRLIKNVLILAQFARPAHKCGWSVFRARLQAR